MSPNTELSQSAREVRKDIIRMLEMAGSGHPGGSLSVTDILVSLYDYMKVDSSNPNWEDRDRVILSKGHAAPALYAVLASKGFFSEDEYKKLRKLGGKLQGHPDMNKTPGVDACTGSLGQGMSTAIGVALAGKYQKKSYKVYSILGDGELNEGIVWEAAASAAHFGLDNLTVIVDWNGLQIDGPNEKIMNMGDIASKFKSFGFKVYEVDGHNMEELRQSYEVMTDGKPKCIVAKTIKGKGVSFMEGKVEWHGSPVSRELAEKALNDLEGVI